MLSRKTIHKQFQSRFQVIDGGSGFVMGNISEADQSQIPAYAFVSDRHVFRTNYPTALRSGMVIKSPAGDLYIVADNGPSEQEIGILWQSFRLFAVSHKLPWMRRTTTLDPVTKLPRESGQQDLGDIYVTLETLDREEEDRKIGASFEKYRIISGKPIEHDDLIGEHTVIRADRTLGVWIGVVR
jgi:hypothetical protein